MGIQDKGSRRKQPRRSLRIRCVHSFIFISPVYVPPVQKTVSSPSGGTLYTEHRPHVGVHTEVYMTKEYGYFIVHDENMQLCMGFRNVVFQSSRASHSSTFPKNYGRGESLGTTNCPKAVVGVSKGMVPVECFCSNNAPSLCVCRVSWRS